MFIVLFLVAVSAVVVDDPPAPMCSGCCSDLCARIFGWEQVEDDSPRRGFSFREKLVETYTTESFRHATILDVGTNRHWYLPEPLHYFRTNCDAFPTLTSIQSKQTLPVEVMRTMSVLKVKEEDPLPSLLTQPVEQWKRSLSTTPDVEFEMKCTVEAFASAFLDTDSPVACVTEAEKQDAISNMKAVGPVMSGTVTTLELKNKYKYAWMIYFNQETTVQFHLRQYGPSRMTKQTTTYTPRGTAVSKEHLDVYQHDDNRVVIKYYVECTGDGVAGSPENLQTAEQELITWTKKYLTTVQRYFSK